MANSEHHWTTIDVGGHSVEVLETAEAPVGAVLWLHHVDGRSVRGREVFERVFSEQRLMAICPQAGPCWWLDGICPAFDDTISPMAFLRGPVMQLVEQRWGLVPPRVAVAGLGMGGQGAVNLAFRHARLFPTVAAIAPDLDFHQWHGCGFALDELFPSKEAARQQTAILHLHPLNWPKHMRFWCDPADPLSFEGTERLLSKLSSTGIPYEADLATTAAGDVWDYCDRVLPEAARFLADRLRETAPDASPSRSRL